MYLVIIYSLINCYVDGIICQDYEQAKSVAQERYMNFFLYDEEIYICELPLSNNNNVNFSDLL